MVAAVFVVLAIDTFISRRRNGTAFLHAEEGNILTTFTIVMVRSCGYCASSLVLVLSFLKQQKLTPEFDWHMKVHACAWI